MMQQVASTKADIAAFAALPGASEQAETSSAFEQVLMQQQKPSPTPVPTSPNRARSSLDELKTADDIKHKRPEPDKISNSGPVEKAPVNQAAADLKTDKNSGQSADKMNSNQQDKQPTASSDKSAATTELDESDDEQVLTESTEQWIDLVWRLQALSAEDSQTTDAETVNPLDIDNIQALQNWLEPFDDKLLALTQLIEAKPQIKTLLAEADLTHSDELNSLFKQTLLSLQGSEQHLASAIGAGNETPLLATDGVAKPMVTEGKKVTADANKPELLQVSEDIAALLKNNRLSASEIEQLNQALSQSLQQNTPLTKEIKDLLQAKLQSTPAADLTVKPGNTAKKIIADMPIIFVPQKDQEGNILEANAAKNTQAVQANKENLQALLDKLAATSNSSAGSPSVQLIAQDTGKIQLSNTVSTTAGSSMNGQTSEQANLLTNDKTILSNTELKTLMTLSSDELDAALNSVAQRIATLLRDETKNVNSTSTKIHSDAAALTTTTASKDILAALKAGVAEFKDQLAAGHEPGLDLKALVVQALEKAGDGAIAGKAEKIAEGLDKSIRTLSHSLAALNQLNDNAAATINHGMNTAALDNQVTQAEQHKAMQFNQVDNKLDKALNLHKPEGHQQLADKVRWMVNTGNLIAEIRLDPAELGSMHVKVSLSAESATVNFVVQSQQTRDALESATPKLREMLAEKGIELGQSSVKQDSQAKHNNQDNQNQAGQQTGNNARDLTTSDGMSDEEAMLAANNRAPKGSANAIDYFV